MPSLVGGVKKTLSDLLAENPVTQAIQNSHILLALEALYSSYLSTGALEMNDTDFELLESYLKDFDKLKDSSKIQSTRRMPNLLY